MKHKTREGNNTSLRNGYTAKYFSHIFRMVFSHLSMRIKKIILFVMIMLFLPLSLLSDDNDTFLKDEVIFETLLFNKYIDTDNDIKPFFVFEISKKDKNIIRSSLDNMDSNISSHTKKGNLYHLIYPDGYSSTIELIKKRIEFIDYFSLNVEIYKNNELLYKFSSDSSEYYDYMYPNCISRHGDSGFDEGVIKINYNKKMTSHIMNFLKINQWSPFVYISSRDDDYIKNINDHKTDVDGIFKRVVDEVFIRKELCDNDECEVQVMVKEGEEFYVISKINGLNSGVCATRRASEAGGNSTPIPDYSNLKEAVSYIELDPPAAGKEKSNVDLAFEKLQTANIVFNTPSSMIRHETETIKLMLDVTKGITDLLKELNATEHESAVVKYSSRMQATLIGENKNAFEITSILPETQAVTSITTTTWKWDVTPLELGEQKLHLALMVFLNTEGEKTAYIVKSFDRVIKVDVSYGDEIFLYIQDKDHWKWILVGLLFPFIGFLWKIIVSKKEEK